MRVVIGDDSVLLRKVRAHGPDVALVDIRTPPGDGAERIAAQLVASERAVERHVTSIFSKLGLDKAAHGYRRVLAVLHHLERQPLTFTQMP